MQSAGVKNVTCSDLHLGCREAHALPEHPESLIETLRAVSQFSSGKAELAEALHRLTELAVEAIEPVDLAGITLPEEHGPRTAVFSDAEAPDIDQAQYDTGVGPCLDAMRTHQVLRIDDTDTDARWKAFCEAASGHGIRSTLSLPLAVGDGGAVGALNLYSRRPGGFSAVDERHAAAFAEQAAVVLSQARAFDGVGHLSPHMQHALASRAVINNAQRILMRRTACTAEQAIEMLRRTARRTDRTLREVAHQIVGRAQGHQR